MSSFQKRNTEKCSILGTKIKNNHIIISSGIPSLDFIVGSGLSVGTIFAAEEDILGNYGKVLLKYFIAEGVVSKHDILVASADENPVDIMKELPQPCSTSADDEVLSDMDKMKIAWRYEGLKQVESSFGHNSNFGHNFDLSKHIDEETIKNTNVTYWSHDNFQEPERKTAYSHFTESMYSSLLETIKKKLEDDTYRPCRDSNNRILRIAIQSIGSPVWMAKECEDETYLNAYGYCLMQFMYMLKVLICQQNAVAYVTIPSYYITQRRVIRRLLYTAANAVRLESFVDTYRRTNPVYKEYHGLFHVTKLTSSNSIVQHVPPSKDIAFKLKRKKFVIEKLHLPPELQETKEREQDDVTETSRPHVPQVGCGGFRPRDIDF